jgi:hypothetical protein
MRGRCGISMATTHGGEDPRHGARQPGTEVTSRQPCNQLRLTQRRSTFSHGALGGSKRNDRGARPCWSGWRWMYRLDPSMKMRTRRARSLCASNPAWSWAPEVAHWGAPLRIIARPGLRAKFDDYVPRVSAAVPLSSGPCFRARPYPPRRSMRPAWRPGSLARATYPACLPDFGTWPSPASAPPTARATAANVTHGTLVFWLSRFGLARWGASS